MSRYLHHITLTTGDSRRSWRHEVDPEIMPQLHAMVEAARAPDGVAIPAVEPPCRLYLEDTARCAMFSIQLGGEPVVTFAVAAHQRCGAQHWLTLIETARVPCRSTAEDRPETPWLAARLEPGMGLLSRDSILMLGDLERIIAWAWLDSRA